MGVRCCQIAYSGPCYGNIKTAAIADTGGNLILSVGSQKDCKAALWAALLISACHGIPGLLRHVTISKCNQNQNELIRPGTGRSHTDERSLAGDFFPVHLGDVL